MPEHNPVRHLYTEHGSDRLEIAKYKVNSTDVFDAMMIYVMMHEWLIENKWCTRNDADFGETFMLMRDNPALGKEYYIRWRLDKSPSYLAQLFSFKLDLNFHIFGLKKKEMMHNGKKIKLNEGEFEVEVIASLIIDKAKMWEKSILRPWRKIYIERVIRDNYNRVMTELFEDAYRLRDAIMSYMKLETVMGWKESTEFWGTRMPE